MLARRWHTKAPHQSGSAPGSSSQENNGADARLFWKPRGLTLAGPYHLMIQLKSEDRPVAQWLDIISLKD